MILRIDTEGAVVEVDDGDATRRIPFSDPEAFALVSKAWLRIGWDVKYVYRFTWLGRPIIQLPEDIVRLQELVFRTKPDVIVETGVAHGGSLVLFASVCEALGHGRVVGVDIEIRPPNRAAIEAHPLSHRITLVEGSSIDQRTFARVRENVEGAKRILVLLDSSHAKEHVREELRLYSTLVSLGSYIVVADGIMRDLAGAPRTNEDWRWNNPLSAADDFLAETDRFVREESAPLFDEGTAGTDVTYSPGGWLRRVR
ncbi:MAG: class I SAM-dependent methyltransferase [Chloroflexi bacterium]|nr:class I SAM-dependent methyltransferase [Chloroflexota bacterium]